jgi:ATP-dependent DNA helicase RecQ
VPVEQCEHCGAPLVLRTARKGRNAGGQFWGCSAWRPGEEHTVRGLDAAPPSVAQPDATAGIAGQVPVPPSRGSHRVKVAWRDSVRRPGWRTRYVGGGATLRCWPAEVLDQARTARSDAWLAVQDLPSYRPAEDDIQRVLGMMTKLLRRGVCPPVPASAENALLAHLRLAGEAGPNRVTVSTPNRPVTRTMVAGLTRWLPDQLDPAIELGSAEELLAAEALLDQVGGQGERIMPQAPLDQLARSWGQDAHGARRLDFLVRDDSGGLIAVEVDGEQHRAAAAVDQDRDAVMGQIGVPVRRVQVDEVRRGLLPVVAAATAPGEPVPLVDGALAMDRLFLALTEAVSRGFLLGDSWTVNLHDVSGLSHVGLPAYLSLLSAIDALWAGDVAPQVVTVRRPGEPPLAWCRSGLGWTPTPAADTTSDVRIVLDLHRSALHVLPSLDDVPTIVVRGARLPVPLLTRASEPTIRIPSRLRSADLPDALRLVVREIFDKPDFLDGQLDAIVEVLQGRDCVVLLPTGAGKSLIYQLAGMLLPGRTIVVDPLVALMEDQVRGLAAYGIDRVVDISSQTTAAGRLDAALQEVAAGDALFVFIAPERLQQQRFRDAMRELAQTTPVNLAVADEAHCVSEWGHDFRTAYLRLGAILRRVCRDGAGVAPPILALTGTASRAVLRDVLSELEITPGSPFTLVKPRTLDRPELSYAVVRTQPSEAQATFVGLLRSLPGRFGVPPEDFFAAAGARTHSGIVFAPHVNGEYGVLRLAERAAAALGETVLPYAGSAPRGIDRAAWEQLKRANAAAFLDNEVPLLVATKAFGMGIDKPNIRYVVHVGIPGSIEAFYQEVGRAGRDRQPARCLLLFSEFNEKVSRSKLDEATDLEQVRALGPSTRQAADDIDRQLFFHLRSFAGVDVEMGVLQQVVNELGDITQPRGVELPMGRDQDSRERALHRLRVLGVVTDYLIDWGGRRFDVVLAGASGQQIIDAFLGYVEQAQPGRAASYQAVVGAERWEKPEQAVPGCARLLIGFVYDTVERARRRSLREMWLAARESFDDAALRRRVLDYLSEGDVAPLLERLAEERVFRFADWTNAMVDLVRPDEAQEWRGSAARLLVSYPDHPGLLLARSISELTDPTGSLAEASGTLAACVQSARARYGVDEADIAVTLTWAVRRFVQRGDADAAAVLAATGREQIVGWAPPPFGELSGAPGPAVIALELRLEHAVERLSNLVSIGDSE